MRIDLTGLGGSSDNMGLDNLAFTQQAASVPEPASVAILGIGAGLLIRRKRK